MSAEILNLRQALYLGFGLLPCTNHSYTTISVYSTAAVSHTFSSMGDSRSEKGSSGKVLLGESFSGGVLSGEAQSGEARSGRVLSREALSGEALSGEALSGEVLSKEVHSGEVLSERVPSGRTLSLEASIVGNGCAEIRGGLADC